MRDAIALLIIGFITLAAWVWTYPQEARDTYEILIGATHD